VTKQTLEINFPDLFLLDGESKRASIDDYCTDFPIEMNSVKNSCHRVVEYLSQFRADNIVWDAEDIRQALIISPTSDSLQEVEAIQRGEADPKPWGCSLGQSYGGFCSMTYLSKVPNPPRIMLFTGGIAPMLETDLVKIYEKFCARVRQRNMAYYKMFPSDIEAVHKIVQKLIQAPVTLPSGGTLTARRFLQLGLMLGSSPSSFTSLHNIIDNAFLQAPNMDHHSEEIQFRRSFLKLMDSSSSFDDAPFYFWLHESIYADGMEHSPTNWAANRACERMRLANKDFDYVLTSKNGSSSAPTLFFGEMVFPWMADDYSELSGIGLRTVANFIAQKFDWPSLYDSNQMQQILSTGRSKAAAAIYFDDMYVDFDESVRVTASGGPMEHCKVFITNEYQHSGLRDDGANIFTKLYGMALGSIRIPS
jgi:hypothetical protein